MGNIISFIFPHPVAGATGGYKVVYEYANRLVADGHTVNIIYSGSLFWKEKSLYYKLTNCVRYIQHILKGYSGRRWFALDKRVKEHLTLSLNYRHVPKSDICICTSPYTAMYVKDYPTDKKYYFIQDYENWGDITDDILRATYHYPLKKIANLLIYLMLLIHPQNFYLGLGMQNTSLRHHFTLPHFQLYLKNNFTHLRQIMDTMPDILIC